MNGVINYLTIIQSSKFRFFNIYYYTLLSQLNLNGHNFQCIILL